MSRRRAVLTLVLVAVVAMVIGLAASALIARVTGRPDPRPEATEPHRPSESSYRIANA